MFFIVVSPFLAVLSGASSPIAEVLNYIPGAVLGSWHVRRISSKKVVAEEFVVFAQAANSKYAPLAICQLLSANC
jgi:hypothetical protein